MDKNILECALKRFWKDSTTEKVLSIEEVPAVGKNLNFLSAVSRLNVKIILRNGRVVNKSLISKVPETSDFPAAFNEKYDTFKTEIMAYKTLTELEYLMEEFEDTEDVLWCKMIHHTLGDGGASIVLEDLKATGFHMIERVTYYDLDHILLAVHSLGRYHGMFKKLEERGVASPQELKTWYFFESEMMHDYIYWDLYALKRYVKKLWDPSWTPIVEKINISKKELHDSIQNLAILDETKFNVINHGDGNKNNILIKYNWDKRPISLRFLDFQLVHYGSPCADLTYMLYMATKPSVRRENYDLILRTYHNALVSTLDKYQFKGNKPSMDEIIDGMDKNSFMGLILALCWYPNMKKSEKMDELHDLDKIKETEGMEGYSGETFEPEGLEEDIGPDIKAFVNKFFSDKQ